MREIKFRAWDGAIMRCDIINIEWTKNTTIALITARSTRDEDGEKHDSILMQYTGLKDKNGKEIYEGDVLNHKYFYSPEFSLEQWEKEEKIIVKIPDFFCYLGSDLVQNSDETMEEFVSHMEVIGNIWEHPDLLECK
jgi:uncharacterized phage protein (TIGR01671 family)